MQNLKIHFLNTIWSDAMILESNKHYAFVDTGSLFYYPMIQKHVEEYNIKHIDFILLTHYHTDHYSNIKSLIENYKVDKLYMKHYYAIEGSTGSGSESNEEYLAKIEEYSNTSIVCVNPAIFSSYFLNLFCANSSSDNTVFSIIVFFYHFNSPSFLLYIFNSLQV